MQLKNAPLSKIPPQNLPSIAGVTRPASSVEGPETIEERDELDDDEQQKTITGLLLFLELDLLWAAFMTKNIGELNLYFIVCYFCFLIFFIVLA